MAKKTSSLADLALGKGQPPAPVAQTATAAPASKDKRKGQVLRLEPGAWKQLKHLATDLGKPVHSLLIEAVNDLFTKYGKPPIA